MQLMQGRINRHKDDVNPLATSYKAVIASDSRLRLAVASGFAPLLLTSENVHRAVGLASTCLNLLYNWGCLWNAKSSALH